MLPEKVTLKVSRLEEQIGVQLGYTGPPLVSFHFSLWNVERPHGIRGQEPVVALIPVCVL